MSRPPSPPASLSPGEARRRATAALLEPGEPAAILGEPAARAQDNAGPSLELGYCGAPFGGPGTTKLVGRTWYGGQAAVIQEVHYDPTLRGAGVIAGLRQGAGQCSEYVDRLGARNRIGAQVDLSGLIGLDAAFGICVESTSTINVTTTECRGYLAWGGLVSVVRVARGSSMEQHREPLRLVATAAATALVTG